MDQPQPTEKLPKAFAALLDEVFAEVYKADPVLAGSCALTGFYLGHRWPKDIDLFITSLDACEFMLEQLGKRVSLEFHQDLEHSNAIAAQVSILDTSINLHCIRRRKERWDHPLMNQRYRITCGSIQLQTLPYLALTKLLSLQSELDKPDKRAVSLFDLQSIFRHLRPEDLACELYFLATEHSILAPAIDLDEALLALPDEAVVDGVIQGLGAFHSDYEPRLRNSWSKYRLQEILGFS